MTTRGSPFFFFAALLVLARPSRAQETPQLPPPPPPSSPPQYVPPSAPTETQPTSPPSRREKEPSRREREREKEREREEKEKERQEKEQRERQAAARARYVPPPPPPAPRDEPPPPARFFQIALRTGAEIPAGDVSAAQGDSMSNAFSVQIPFLLEIGVKVHPMIFLGAYGGPSIGGTSSVFSGAQSCSSSRSCIGTDWRVGLEVQVHFRPAERLNPWVGYGIGYEAASVTASGGGMPEGNESFSGLELARIAAGLDFRLSKLFGVGPFAEVDFGSYSHEHVQTVSPPATSDQSIPNTALHEWISVGVRGVLFP
jgi:hypothetical protein